MLTASEIYAAICPALDPEIRAYVAIAGRRGLGQLLQMQDAVQDLLHHLDGVVETADEARDLAQTLLADPEPDDDEIDRRLFKIHTRPLVTRSNLPGVWFDDDSARPPFLRRIAELGADAYMIYGWIVPVDVPSATVFQAIRQEFPAGEWETVE